MNQTPNIAPSLLIKDRSLMVLFAFLVVALCMNLGSLELSGEEPRRAVVAYEMMTNGDYLVPHAYGQAYYKKPPLFNWFLAGWMKLFGPTEVAVRLTGLISFLLIGFLIYRWTARHLGAEKAILPALLFLTSADLILYASVFSGEIDLTFTLFLFVQAIGIFRIGLHPKDILGYLLAYSFLGLTLFTKGFHGVHFHFFTLIVWATYNHNFRALFNKKHLLFIVALLSVLALYYYCYSLHGHLTYLLLSNLIESSSKVTDTSFASLLNQATECPMVLIKISLPWTILLFLVFKKEVRRFIGNHPIFVFSVIYIVSNVWLYWFFIDVRDRYLYPFVPFICIFLAAIVFSKKWWPQRRTTIYGLVGVMIGLRIFYNLFIIPQQLSGELSHNYIYRDLVSQMTTIAEGNEINFFVPPLQEALPWSCHGVDSLPVQPRIPYQISYYLIEQTGHAPILKNKLSPGSFYITYANQKNNIEKSDSLYQFTEQWFGKEMRLIRAH